MKRLKIILVITVVVCLISSLNLSNTLAKDKFVAIGKQDVSSSPSPAAASSQNKPEFPDISSLRILSRSAKIIDRFDAEISPTFNPEKQTRVIIHIQDMHCNYEAQLNISKVITEMYKRYGMKLMLLEGASSKLDASFFNPFSRSVRDQVAKKYMKLGQITGPEYLLMAKSDDVLVQGYGIEDKDLYLQHLEVFNQYYPSKQKLQEYLANIKYVFNRLKDKMYTPVLKKFEEKVTDFEDKKLGFKEYMKYLVELVNKYRIDISEFKSFQDFARVLERESKIDYNKANKQKDILLKELSKLLTKPEYDKVQAKSLSFKRGYMTPAEFYRYLSYMIRKVKIDITKYPELKDYIDFITVSDAITNAELFKQIGYVHDKVKMDLAKTLVQKELVRLDKNLQILDSLANIKLTKDGVAYFDEHKNEFNDEMFMDFIQKNAKKYRVPIPNFKNKNIIKQTLPVLEKFYELAVKRDKALGDNILRLMNEEQENMAVVVTGGFHTDGIDEMLKGHGISYVVVSPLVTQEYNEQIYYDVLTKPRPTIDDIVEDARQLENKKK